MSELGIVTQLLHSNHSDLIDPTRMRDFVSVLTESTSKIQRDFTVPWYHRLLSAFVSPPAPPAGDIAKRKRAINSVEGIRRDLKVDVPTLNPMI